MATPSKPRRYYLVALRDGPHAKAWCPHIGFYSRDDAKGEVDELHACGWRRGDMRILSTPRDAQAACGAAIHNLNA